MTAIGKIKIPSIGCTFDLSWQNSDVNAHHHYARLFKQNGAIAVGNHYNSHSESGGYWKLENLKIGDKAHLEYVTGNGCEVIKHKGDYKLYALMLLDVVGLDFHHNGKEVKPSDPSDLICVCCVGRDNTKNYVAFFERVS